MTDYYTETGLRVHLISEREVAEVRRRYEDGASAAALARELRVHRTTIVNIVKHRTHKDRDFARMVLSGE